MPRPEEVPKLVTFGKGGHDVHFGRVEHENGHSSSKLQGYESPESFEARDLAAEPWTYEGVRVLDTRAATDTLEGFKWAINGPMVDVDLDDGATAQTVDVSPGKSIVADALADDPGNALGSFVRLQRSHKGNEPGPLDSVPIGAYLHRWWEHGATVGHIAHGRIIWTHTMNEAEADRIRADKAAAEQMILAPFPPEGSPCPTD